MTEWPTYEPGPVERLRALGATVPWNAYAEMHVPASPERVWELLSDLPRQLPRMVTDLRSAHWQGDELFVRGWLGQRARFALRMHGRWCWMQSRFLIGGFAVDADGSGARVAFLGALRLPGLTPTRRWSRLTAPLARRALRRLAVDVADAERPRSTPPKA